MEFVRRPLPALRIVGITALVPGPDEVGPVVGPAFGQVAEALAAIGASLALPVAAYDGGGHGLRISIGYAHDGSVDGLEVIDLPAVDDALCIVHHGSMATIQASWAALGEQLTVLGLREAGPCREVYLRAYPPDDDSQWVTELQQPVRGAV